MNSTAQDNFLLFGQFYPLDMNCHKSDNKQSNKRKCNESQDHSNKKLKTSYEQSRPLFLRKTDDNMDAYPYFTSQYKRYKGHKKALKTVLEDEAEKEAIRQHLLQIQKEARISFGLF